MDPEKELVDAAGRDRSERQQQQQHLNLAESETVDDNDSGPSAAVAQKQKTDDILDACTWRDAARLRSLAESEGGLLTDTLRQSAWPILLGLPPPSTDETDGEAHSQAADPDTNTDTGDWKDLPRHRDEDQVQLDVNRSFVHYPNDQSDAELDRRKRELSCLIAEVLRRHPYLCYFQGYHDICQVFLLVLEPSARARMVARLSVLRIRDFMLPSLGPTTAQLRLLPDVLAHADPELRRHVATIEPFYALAGTLTMYAHNIERYQDIARLFDVILAREPVFTIYMFAQIIIDRRDEVLDIDEHDMLQVILGRVPANMDLDALIENSVDLFARYPPETLRSWSRISSASVLKTARDVDACAQQTLEDGHRYFQKQDRELHWAEMGGRVKMAIWAYRRPARTIGMAVGVGVVALYLRRNPAVIEYILDFLPRLW